MAKLAKLMNKIAGLKKQLAICDQAYINLLKRYNKLYQKYSYEEIMERVKKVEKLRIEEGSKILWENLKKENPV